MNTQHRNNQRGPSRDYPSQKENREQSYEHESSQGRGRGRGRGRGSRGHFHGPRQYRPRFNQTFEKPWSTEQTNHFDSYIKGLLNFRGFVEPQGKLVAQFFPHEENLFHTLEREMTRQKYALVQKQLFENGMYLVFEDRPQRWLQDNFTFSQLKAPYDASFMRGVFDACGHVPQIDSTSFFCYLDHPDQNVMRDLTSFCEGKGFKGNLTLVTVRGQSLYRLSFNGVNAQDFLGWMYERSSRWCRNPRHYGTYMNWVGQGLNSFRNCPSIRMLKGRYFKMDENEDTPTPRRVRASDVGFDLALVGTAEKKADSNLVTFYRTNYGVEPPFGYHYELVPRSSLAKTGYMLANNVGIIDPSYRGEVLVALIKVDPQAAPLTMGEYYVQLILRPTYYHQFYVTSQRRVLNTSRGSGGFGSTDVNDQDEPSEHDEPSDQEEKEDEPSEHDEDLE